jgi:hypothetical protein
LIGEFSSSAAGVVDQLEQAAALQVGAHGCGDDAGSHRVAGKSAMVTGIRLAPAPVISMDSWAWANVRRSTGQKPGKHGGKFGHVVHFHKDSRDFTLQTVCI